MSNNMTTQAQSPFDTIVFYPRITRGNTYRQQTKKRRATLATYVATRDYLAGIAPRPAVMNSDAVAMWERETYQAKEA